VRFTVAADDAAPVTTVVPLDGAHRPSVTVKAAHVKWSAQLLGAREAVLRFVERDELPVASEVKPVAVLTPPPPPPVTPGTWVRPAGVAVGLAGLIGGGVGIVLGIQANDARARLAGAQTDMNGVVIGLTQADAAKLNVTATSGAVAANVLMIAGGVLTGTGLLMFLLGPDEPSPVKLSLGVGGVSGSVRF
jgi:hypothetical protein